jgi:protocatechuate 3,4-dioxygenase beta subunit
VPEPIDLTVRATWKGEPVAGAEVSLGQDAPRVTNARGEVQVKGLAADDLTLVVTKGELVGGATLHPLPGRAHYLEVPLEQGVRVRGVVVDEKGAPRLGRVRGLPPPLLETDAKGRFESALLRPNREYRLTPMIEGCDAETGDEVALTDHDAEVVLKVRCEVTASGQVFDGNGDPIGNALVSLQGLRHTETTTTDAAGHFSLHRPAGDYRLEVTHERYRKVEQPLTLPAKDVTIVMDAGGSIAGRVVDGDGKPLQGLEVIAAPAMLEDLFREMEGQSAQKAKSDEQGRFVVTGLLAGRWLVAASGAGTPMTPSEAVSLQPGQHLEGVEIRVDAKVDLSGTVLDEQKQPVVGARVSWDPVDEKAMVATVLLDTVKGGLGELFRYFPSEAYSDAEGRFELRGLALSQVKLEVRANGFAEVERVVSRGERADITLTRVGGVIRGRVVEASGRAVSRFAVNGSDFTASDGRFEVKAWQTDDSIRVTARGFVPTHLDVKLEGREKDVGDVVLRPARTLRVEVTTEDGRPLEGARVAAAQPGAGGDSCTTNAEGRCEATPLGDEETTLKAAKKGFVPVERTLPKEQLQDVARLTLKPGGGVVVGDVFGAPGKPAGARSVYVSSDAMMEVALSDTKGHFEVNGLKEGKYCVSLENSGLIGTEWAVPVQVTPSTPPVAVGPSATGGTLEFSRTIPGRVVLAGGATGPLPRAQLGSTSASSFCERLFAPTVTLIVTGTARLEGVPAGAWSVYVQSLADDETETLAPTTVEVRPGTVTKVP